MAKLDHTYDAIADIYAGTLLQLSEAAGNSEKVQAELVELVELMDKVPTFGDFMLNPAIDADNRRAVLEKVFRGKLDDLSLDALQVINRKGRCEIVPLISERYRLQLEEVRDEVDVYVTSAAELPKKLRRKVQEAATRLAGKTARLVEKVDPEVLGGLVVRIRDQKIDASVFCQLGKLREALRERALHEIHGGKDYFQAANG